MSIRSIEYRGSQTGGVILDWRTPRFTAVLKHGRWVPGASNVAFVLRPEDAPVAYVQLRSSDDAGYDAAVYPSTTVENAGGDPDTLVIGLRSSAACPANSPMHVDAIIDGKPARSDARAGHQAVLHFAHASNGADRGVEIRSLAVRGATGRCNVAQTFFKSASDAAPLRITDLRLP
jgi:hypothetical protein